MREILKPPEHYLSAAFIALVFLMTGCSPNSGLPSVKPDLDLDIPALPDFAGFKTVEKKKEAFIDYLLPIVQAHDAHIRKVRGAALALQGETLSEGQRQWLSRLAKYYRIESGEDRGKEFWRAVKHRVAIVPASLALAQAANESAWGTSRFALEGNNLFGEWCFQKGCGIVPKYRAHGATNEVEAFDDVGGSVGSYIHNINVNQAYAPLRAIRSRLRRDGKSISGLALARGLVNYSERGKEYIKIISAMISHNHLGQYDGVSVASAQ